MNSEKKVLLGMSLDELKAAVKELGMPQFTAGQIAKWLYQQHVRSIDEMTNISKANRERLAEEYTVGAMDPIDCQRSKDGTIKYLFPVGDGQKFVETVYTFVLSVCYCEDDINKDTSKNDFNKNSSKIVTKFFVSTDKAVTCITL